jgi:hypothetical protein
MVALARHRYCIAKHMLEELPKVLFEPEVVRRSRSDSSVSLFYRFYARTVLGSKWLCIVVKYGEHDAFIVTAYLTDQPKAGEDLWPKE